MAAFFESHEKIDLTSGMQRILQVFILVCTLSLSISCTSSKSAWTELVGSEINSLNLKECFGESAAFIDTFVMRQNQQLYCVYPVKIEEQTGLMVLSVKAGIVRRLNWRCGELERTFVGALNAKKIVSSYVAGVRHDEIRQYFAKLSEKATANDLTVDVRSSKNGEVIECAIFQTEHDRPWILNEFDSSTTWFDQPLTQTGDMVSKRPAFVRTVVPTAIGIKVSYNGRDTLFGIPGNSYYVFTPKEDSLICYGWLAEPLVTDFEMVVRPAESLENRFGYGEQTAAASMRWIVDHRQIVWASTHVTVLSAIVADKDWQADFVPGFK